MHSVGIVFLLSLLTLSECVEVGDILRHFSHTLSSMKVELQKRGVHEEHPLIYIADDHPLEHYWTPPYYPSRS